MLVMDVRDETYRFNTQNDYLIGNSRQYNDSAINIFKDTVTIFKFLRISELSSNRRFRRDQAQNVNFLSLANNYWV